MLFDFLFSEPYEDRAVARHESDGLIIDTCAVNDGDMPFETGISSKLYNGGKWVIVEAYETKEAAQIGHDKWVDVMLTNPPTVLKDCANAEIGRLAADIGCDTVFEKKAR